MTPERWRQISALLDEILEWPAAERAARLDRLCADDPGLRTDVERLLRADEDAGEFLSRSFDHVDAWIEEGGHATAHDRDDPLCGATVGSYRIIREIGRGGMGIVFLADRADGAFDQRVALKVIHRSSTSEPERHRFLRERQILAQLDHPSVARVFDGGMTADGRPYFAMEYVDGDAITTYCADRRLGVEDRIRLYVNVCRAVEAAHQHFIVHRDLKPSNILVSRDGRVKLLDFGIAKPLDRDAFLTVTQTGGHPMTPEYAAPEHIRHGAITVMTDVYGLGVVLYELLTGDRPLRGDHPLELAAAVVEREPVRPSAAVGDAHLRRRLRGDLDTIILTALRKEPERRYQSVGAFRTDLERYLRRQPILARADSVTYRARRFAQRHRVGVAAAVVVVLSLVSGIAGVLWQARAASQQARRVEAVKTFMAGVFRLSDPSEAVGQTLKAREILDLASRRIDTELAAAPEIQADMLTLIGRIYTQVGLYPNAAPLLERGLEQRRHLYRAGQVEIGDSLDALGVLQTRQGRFAEAERTLEAALDVFGNRRASESANRATALNHLGAVQFERANHRAAEASIQEALAIRRRLFGDRHPAVAESLELLAQVRRNLGNLDGAMALDREALDIRRAQFGPDHPDVISSLGSLALDAFDKGQYRDSEALYGQALDAAGRTLGTDHPDTLEYRISLAAVMAQQGRVAESEVMLRDAIAAKRRRVGESHPGLISNLNNLASTVMRLDRADEAEQLYREALSMAERELGPNHVEVAKNLNDLAMLLKDRGRLDEAEALVRRSLPILRGVLGETHSYVGRATANLARVLFARGVVGEAEKSYRRALAILRGSLPGGHSVIGNVAFDLARLLMQTDRPDDAEPLLREAIATRESSYGERDERTAEAKLALGECLLAKGRSADAWPLLDASYQALRLALGQAHELTRRAAAARRRAEPTNR